MENTIIGAVGSAVGVVGLVLFLRLLIFKLGGAETLGTVLSARQDTKGRYIHTMKYTAGGSEITSEDAAGYSRALENGSEELIIYSKSSPKEFKFAQEVRMQLLGFGILALMGAAFAVRFLVL